MTSPLQGFEKQLVRILDSSAAIECKRSELVPLDEQWDFWDSLLALVQSQQLIFPAEVRKELSGVRHPDMPGSWAPKAWQEMRPKPTPADQTLAQVVEAFPSFVDENSDKDTADPYVVALALERRSDGFDVRVVADDGLLREACDFFGIAVETAEEFVEHARA